MRHFHAAKKPPSPATRLERRPSRSASPPADGHTGPATPTPSQAADGQDEDEDDYMTMTFADTPAVPETSLQRRQRLHADGLKRGLVPSKAELAAQERARREEGLSQSLLHAAAPSKSKGLAMMAKMGFTPGATLGPAARPAAPAAPAAAAAAVVAAAPRLAEPLRIEVRADRGGLGLDGERKRKAREAAGVVDEEDPNNNNNNSASASASGAKKPRPRALDPVDYRDRRARERDAARKEALVGAAQKMAERMDEDRAAGLVDGDDQPARERKRAVARAAVAARPLRAVPVVYRGLVRHREDKERERRMRHDRDTSLGTLRAHLPGYEDEGMDEHDQLALGREATTVYVPVHDLDDEDEELDRWEALEVDQRLKNLVEYLRDKYSYCFWCKFAYPDESMDGCPGLTEEDHD